MACSTAAMRSSAVPGSAESATSMFCVRRAESKDATRGCSCRATLCEPLLCGEGQNVFHLRWIAYLEKLTAGACCKR